MVSNYYKPCSELDRCKELNKYWGTNDKMWFDGYFQIANETHYPLAECQLGYCYLKGIGTKIDISKAIYWTELAASHGDRDAQYNIALLIEEGKVKGKNIHDAILWYKKGAVQGHDLAIQKYKELVTFDYLF